MTDSGINRWHLGINNPSLKAALDPPRCSYFQPFHISKPKRTDQKNMASISRIFRRFFIPGNIWPLVARPNVRLRPLSRFVVAFFPRSKKSRRNQGSKSKKKGLEEWILLPGAKLLVMNWHHEICGKKERRVTGISDFIPRNIVKKKKKRDEFFPHHADTIAMEIPPIMIGP